MYTAPPLCRPSTHTTWGKHYSGLFGNNSHVFIYGFAFYVMTHSNILSWEMLWTKEPGMLQSMGFQESWTSLSDENNDKIDFLSSLIQLPG